MTQHVPWSIAVGPELIAEWAGISLRQFYLDADSLVTALAAARRRWLGRFGVDALGPAVRVSTPSYVGACAMGGAVMIVPENDDPMVVGHPLERPDDVYGLRRPESYLDHPAMAPYVAMYRRLSERLEGTAPVGFAPGIQGPITTAKLLRGQDFFLDVALHPEEAHHLLDFVTESNLAFYREVRELQGLPATGRSVGLTDDFAGLLGPARYREYALPCYHRFYGELRADRRTLHSELLRPGHLAFLAELRIDSLNLGENQYVTPRDVLAATSVKFNWNVKGKTMLHGTPAEVREEYLDSVAQGAPEMTVDLCARGIPEANLRAFVEVAAEHGPFVGP